MQYILTYLYLVITLSSGAATPVTLSEHGDHDWLLDVGDVGSPARRDLVGWKDDHDDGPPALGEDRTLP